MEEDQEKQESHEKDEDKDTNEANDETATKNEDTTQTETQHEENYPQQTRTSTPVLVSEETPSTKPTETSLNQGEEAPEGREHKGGNKSSGGETVEGKESEDVDVDEVRAEKSTKKRQRKRKRKNFKDFKPGFRKSTRTASREDTTISSLEQLAQALVTGCKVVFLTGAGLSVASGIPPFRGATDAVWTQSVREWGTRKKFQESPLAWYNTFWLKHFDESKGKDYKPNPGHEAIAKLCKRFASSVNVITQNVDRLHRHTSGAVAEEQLIEIHGFAGAFKCLTEDCAYAESKLHRAELNVSSTNDGTIVQSVEYLPKCPDCNEIMCPNVLLFDEDYDSHESYQFDKAREWLEAADVIAFVGTSFAVHITNLAFEHARDRSVPAVAYNFNVIDNLPSTKASTIETRLVLGKTEETLPKLVDCVVTLVGEAISFGIRKSV